MNYVYNKKIIYTAYFVMYPEKLLHIFPPKHTKIFAHHLTIAFKPNSLENIEIGKKSILKIIGRVFDEKGDALLVKTDKSNKKYPHITISCNQFIDPIYSDEMIERAFKNNTVEFLDSPIEIEVIEGYFDGENDIIQ